MSKRGYLNWGQFLGRMVLLLGVVLLGYLLVSLLKDLSLWMFGQQIEAQVVETWAEPYRGSVEEGVIDYHYFLRYQFVTDKGKLITNSSKVSPNEWAGIGRAGAAYAMDDPLGGQQAATAPVYHEQAHIPQEFEMGGINEGQTIAVRYFPLLPTHNSLENTRFIPVYLIGYVVIGLLALFVLTGGWSMIKSPPMADTKLWVDVLPDQNGSA